MDKIFVLGAARSGTTMMSRVLGNHPSIFTFGELHFFEELWPAEGPARELDRARALRLAADLLTVQRQGYYARRTLHPYRSEAEELLASLSKPPTAPVIFEAFIRAETRRHAGEIACLHTPRDVHYLRDILELFPSAMVLLMMRDPRAVLASQKQRWRRYHLSPRRLPRAFLLQAWLNYHPVTYSLIWKRAARVADAFRGHPRVQVVQFEALLERPIEEMKRICDFLGLEFVDDMLMVPQAGSSHRPDHWDRLGLDLDAASRWRGHGLNATEIWLCQNLTRMLMLRHGYRLQDVSINLARLVYYASSWAPKSALAFMLNLRRMRSPLGALMRRVGRIVSVPP